MRALPRTFLGAGTVPRALFVAVAWFPSAAAQAQNAGAIHCAEQEDDEVRAAAPEWVRDAVDGSRHVEAFVAGDRRYTAIFQVRLGALRHAWSEGGLEVDPDGTLRVTVEPPPEAWLHELAAVYVTDLAVRIVGHDEEREVLSVDVPPAYLVWPGGRGTRPVVLDQGAMEREAPRGILDAAVRARMSHDEDQGRVLPPIRFSERPFNDDEI